MDLLPFSQQNPIPEQYFNSLVKAQIYCWGREPFSEYKKCTNSSCQKLFSIEDFFNSPSLSTDFLHTNLDCLSCNSPTRDVYEWSEFSEVLRNYFSEEISGILLIDKQEVKGFNLFRKTDIEGLFEWEFATREDGFQNPELKKVITETLQGCESVICWQHLFIDETIRSERLFWSMLLQLFSSKIDTDMPVVLETKYESRVYPFLRLLGFQELCKDKHGYVMLQSESFYNLRGEIQRRKTRFPTGMRELKIFLKEAREKMKNNS